MSMRLYDTARQAIVEFNPPEIVKIYTCGVTPYDTTHIGHAACFIGYDVLQRRLRDLGHETRCVRNVTDVDDSILAKAREKGVHYLDLAAEEEPSLTMTWWYLASWTRTPNPEPPRQSPTFWASLAWSSTKDTLTKPVAPSTSM